MYKIIFLFTITIIVFNSCKTSVKTNDLKTMNIYGNVETLIETSNTVEVKFGEIRKKENDWTKTIYTFSKTGNFLDIYSEYFDGFLYKNTYKYDENDNKIEYNDWNFDGSLKYKTTYKYDENGKMLEENHYYDDGSLNYRTIYIYDNKLNNIERIGYKSDGSIESKSLYEYNNFGLEIEFKSFTSDGRLVFHTTNEYDKNGNNIENKTLISPFEKTIGIAKHKRNNEGNIIQTTYYDLSGNLMDSFSYSYDDKGNPTNNTQYKYDRKGNWIEKIEFDENKPVFIIEREFKYY